VQVGLGLPSWSGLSIMAGMDRIKATRPSENRRLSTFSRDFGAAIRNVPSPTEQKYCGSIVLPMKLVCDIGGGGSMIIRDVFDVSFITGRAA
jgi:hypothetical protein